MSREGRNAAEVWRANEMRSLDGAGLREAMKPGGALERLVGKGKTGKAWDEPRWRGGWPGSEVAEWMQWIGWCLQELGPDAMDHWVPEASSEWLELGCMGRG